MKICQFLRLYNKSYLSSRQFPGKYNCLVLSIVLIQYHTLFPLKNEPSNEFINWVLIKIWTKMYLDVWQYFWNRQHRVFPVNTQRYNLRGGGCYKTNTKTKVMPLWVGAKCDAILSLLWLVVLGGDGFAVTKTRIIHGSHVCWWIRMKWGKFIQDLS